MAFSEKVIIGLIIVLIIITNAISLMGFPQPHGDEAWLASRAWAFLQTGKPFGTLDGGVLDQYEGYENFYPWLSTAIQSLGISLIGTPSLMAIRTTSMIIGIIFLISIYYIGVALDSRQFGFLSLMLTAFSFAFFVSAHQGRADILAAALGFSGIALYLHNRSAKVWLSFLAGFIVTLAIEVHPNAAIYSITIITLFFYRDRLRIFKKTDFWGYVAGSVLGVLIYFGTHILPNPQTFLRLNQILFTRTHIPPLLTFNLSTYFKALSDMAIMAMIIYPQIILGIWAIYKFRKGYPKYFNIILIMNGAILLSFALLVRTKYLYYYAIYFSPALSLLIAAMFNEFLKSPIKSKFEYRLRQLIIFSVSFLPVVLIFIYGQNYTYYAIQLKVSQAIKPSDSIMGNQLFWFGLTENDYYSWENLVFYRRDKPGSTVEDAFLALRPDIFIVDNQVRNFSFDGDIDNNYAMQLRVPKFELEAFLNQYAELETIIEQDSNNPVLIYRLDYR